MMMQPDYDVTLEDQIRECYGRVVYTHKTHEVMADICIEKLNCYKKLQILLTALISVGTGSVFFADETWVKLVTAFLSFVTLFISTYLKNFDLGAIAQKHRDTAAKLWNIRECYLSLLTDIPTTDRTIIVERRDELQLMLSALYETAPQTNGKAYTAAQKRLKHNEDMTFSAEEIDCFLPLSLKRSGGRLIR